MRLLREAALENVEAARDERGREEPKASAAKDADQNTSRGGEFGSMAGFDSLKPVD